MHRCLFVGIVLAAVAARPAAAEDVRAYIVDGNADAGGSDPRIAALDEAFGRAVSRALGDVLDGEVRKANKPAIDREIIGRARLWVAKFSVEKDETVDGRRQLTVRVSVDRDKVRARLGELNITIQPDAAAVPPGATPSVVALRVVAGEQMRATYGPTGEKDIPGLGALSTVLRGGGFAVVRAPVTSGAGTPAQPAGELPLTDDEAAALAVEAKADAVAIAGVTVGTPVAVRGEPVFASLVTAHVRVLGRDKQLIGQGTGTAATRGAELTVVTAAVDRAVSAAAGDAIPARRALDQATGFTGDDTPASEPGVVLVRLPAKTPYALVADEVKFLTGARGVASASVRRLSPGGWVIGVRTSESVQRIANIARKAPTSDTSARVKLDGDIVEVTLVGSP